MPGSNLVRVKAVARDTITPKTEPRKRHANIKQEPNGKSPKHTLHQELNDGSNNENYFEEELENYLSEVERETQLDSTRKKELALQQSVDNVKPYIQNRPFLCDELEKILDSTDEPALRKYIADQIRFRLATVVQRIRRKIVYIVSYRKFQIVKEWVPIDSIENKYYNPDPDQGPTWSARSFLKLLRWCRFFLRDLNFRPYLKTKLKPPSIENYNKLLEQLRTSNYPRLCWICGIDEHCQMSAEMIPFCQQCVYRKQLFLYGNTLACCECNCDLGPGNFEFWTDRNWCQACLWGTCLEKGYITYK